MDDRLSNDLASLRIDRRARPPGGSAGRRVLLWIAALAGVTAVGVALWRLAAPQLEARFFRTEVGITEVALVSPAQAQVQLTSTGYVVPQVQVDVSSKLVGRVASVNAREGGKVKAGQVLFELDASDQRVAVASARARVAAAKARAATARAQLAEIVQQRDRERRLANTGAIGTASADDLDARARSLEEQVRAADADVAASDAEVTALAINLTNTTIRAPVDGTVLTKPLQPGDVVTPGTPMAKIADFDSIVVETDVPEGRLRLVRPGAPCEIVLDAYPDRRWRGEIVETGPQLNRAKASATVKVRFLDRDDSVLPEMAARVSFLDSPLDQKELAEPPKRVVPAAAVAERAGAKVVFVVDGDHVRMVPVTLGAPFGGGFELQGEPAPGTKLVADPPATLADGQAIKERSAG
ncbi:MAG: efflux RND transporter periplasmic adaptor subunit [Myxococcales bacterium]|nr:efflux RND transporter periplasmic adaptor subunit [Myxococcales bacterium]